MKRRLTIGLLLTLCSLFGEDRPQTLAPAVSAVEVVSDIFLGVDVVAMNTAERVSIGNALPPQQGLKVRGVVQGSPAEKAGLKAGDVLLLLNGYPLDSREDLLISMRYSRPGHIVHLSVLRGGQLLAVPVAVAARPQPVSIGRVVPHERQMSDAVSLSRHQSAVARLLSREKVDWASVHRELDALCRLPDIASSSGNIRLFYRLSDACLTVSRTRGNITLEFRKGGKVADIPFSRPVDSLPAEYRAHFAEFAGQ